MTGLLSAEAELYLRQLEKELWPLGSAEREAILLELRGHLEACSSQGGALRLADALASMGTPEEFARAFVVEGAGDARRRAGLPSRDLVPLAPPPEYERTPDKMRLAEMIGQVRATFRAGRPGFFLIGALLVALLTATNFAAFMHELRPGIVEQIWPVMLVRVAVVVMALAAAYRALLTEEHRIWAVDLSTFRFAGGLIAVGATTILTVLAIVTPAKALLALLPETPAMLLRGALILVLLGAISAMFLRIQPWLVGLAIDRREITLKAALRETRGKTLAIVKAWAVIVLPLYVLHFVLTAFALSWKPFNPGHLMIAGIDGIVSALIVIGAALLNATIFRWAAHEAIPPARPFAPDLPEEQTVEEARLRIRRYLAANPARAGR